MIFLLIAVLIFSQIIFSQNKERPFSLENNSIKSKLFLQKGDSLNKVIYFYKIPYSTIIFEKNVSGFKSKFDIELEIKDSNQEVIFRKFDSHTIELNNFELTRSVKDFYTGFIEFFLPKDSFQINISFNDLT
ncbi:MAG: hypothetical protein N2043_08985, partial [Ignavibacterium sp.]|nr:hypothetical protein [Ignavibacterium sp.]